MMRETPGVQCGQAVLPRRRKLRELFAHARARTFQRAHFIVYEAQVTPAATTDKTAMWCGLGDIARPDDAHRVAVLDPQYEAMRLAGDSALLAYSPSGALIGWAWVRKGPYRETAGPGVVMIPMGVRVIRYFEVSPKARGAGVGQAILGELTQRLSAEPSLRTIALVEEHNVASRRCFERAGFGWTNVVEAWRIAGWRKKTALPLYFAE
jgi:ribosomal protein S18 acetylase RimI-like enzyme